MECSRIKLDGKPCERISFARGLCLFHDSLDRAKQRKTLSKEAWAQILDSLWTFQDDAKAKSILAETLDHLTPKEAVAFRWKVQAELFRYTQETQHLCLLADNKQNVHTRPVGAQTEQTLSLLRTLERPTHRATPSLVMDAWMMHDKVPGDRMVSAGEDMFKWYDREPLYAELLDLLWVYIQNSLSQDELILRLYQETKESHNKCLSGALARLCNVLVGFDDRFNPPASVAELLQHTLLVISQKPIPVEEKVGHAWKVFEELKTPMDQREAWIREF